MLALKENIPTYILHITCSYYFCLAPEDALPYCTGCVMHVFILTFTDNPLLSTKVSVTVNVLDVNEFAPELAVPSDTFVCENSRVGQVKSNCIHIAPTTRLVVISGHLRCKSHTLSFFYLTF